MKTVISWILGLLSAFMIYDGILIFVQTSGPLSGSEFGMLITISSQISLVMVWLGLFAIRSQLPDPTAISKPALEKTEA